MAEALIIGVVHAPVSRRDEPLRTVGPGGRGAPGIRRPGFLAAGRDGGGDVPQDGRA